LYVYSVGDIGLQRDNEKETRKDSKLAQTRTVRFKKNREPTPEDDNE
jgi:ribosome-associated protein YbcJ (S4-like RNA binding protein)